MGPREAAFCVKKFLPTPKMIIPMQFNMPPVLTGTFEEFEKYCNKMKVDPDKHIVHPKVFLGGYIIH